MTLWRQPIRMKNMLLDAYFRTGCLPIDPVTLLVVETVHAFQHVNEMEGLALEVHWQYFMGLRGEDDEPAIAPQGG